ncbi:hypothetical protein A5893_14685 [Pedobacter psychrophilus]|uniref:Peptidylprolyl isomerase n=1 Tax=Pedobacter psychrophilus TaxID=1826909 RepID=A0A179DDQ8_9SPHI|nr:hypothetical protein [Pedobacter psychrophilus]OAQ38649.1 hypothetical protein A5893_14685 [Pedobacter psychrophilus]
MMRIIRISIAVFVCSFTVISCNYFSKPQDKPIAKAFDNYLYSKDLDGVVPQNTHGSDSVSIVWGFIDQWLHEQAIQHQAEENVKPNDKTIQDQLDVYKRSLIRFQYEQELIRQKLDTIVNEKEIASFYEINKENFQLKKPILKVSYIKLSQKAPKIAMVKKLFTSKDLRDFDLLEKYCFKYSTNFSLMDTTWHYTEELAQILPISKIGENNYENLNRIFEISENNTLYLLILRDSKFKDSLSPLAFEKQNIKNLIINQRKLTLINQMEKSIFNEAQKNNELEIYHK